MGPTWGEKEPKTRSPQCDVKTHIQLLILTASADGSDD